MEHMSRARVTVWQGLARAPWRFLFGRWPWLALLYLLASALIAAALAILSILTLLFLPLWGILIGMLERQRTRLLGFPRQASGHVPLGQDERQNWLNIRMLEAATWREVAALLLNVVFGGAALVLLVAEAASLAMVWGIAWLFATQDPEPLTLFGDGHLALDDGNWWQLIPLGILAFALFAYINALLAAAQASLLRLLVGPRQRDLDRNVARLTRSRATLVAAFEAERRRIERDLHDGVQQELVTLAARLGMVSLEVEDLAAHGADTGAARQALDSAQDQAEHAMETLRRTVRGIHPAVLTDHGLHAALHELADRTPVPIQLELADFARTGVAAETAAYYLVTEAVTNAAKHTAATRVTVRARAEGTELRITVTDNGHGGAEEGAGTGLRGLRERAETLSGSFALDSPSGGPTTITMVLPIAHEDRNGAFSNAHTAG